MNVSVFFLLPITGRMFMKKPSQHNMHIFNKTRPITEGKLYPSSNFDFLKGGVKKNLNSTYIKLNEISTVFKELFQLIPFQTGVFI
jgi:hypothetical protein